MYNTINYIDKSLKSDFNKYDTSFLGNSFSYS